MNGVNTELAPLSVADLSHQNTGESSGPPPLRLLPDALWSLWGIGIALTSAVAVLLLAVLIRSTVADDDRNSGLEANGSTSSDEDSSNESAPGDVAVPTDEEDVLSEPDSIVDEVTLPPKTTLTTEPPIKPELVDSDIFIRFDEAAFGPVNHDKPYQISGDGRSGRCLELFGSC